MEQQNYQYQDNSVFVQERSVAKKFFANVFLWMFVALAISTLAAYFISASAEAQSYLFDPLTGKRNLLGTVAMFAPLALVLIMGAGFNRLSFSALVGIFILFSTLLGISLSFILVVYNLGSVVGCFAAASGIFGVMAIMGYTTNTDLSKFGPILMAGVIGLIIASVINMFIGSSQFDYIMSFFGVAIFTALTAFDVQKIKRIGMGIEENGEQLAVTDTKKLAIMSALTLYLDFLNIFLFLLRIFGSRK
ncbi:Bax inhibitor-1/YccA family protein [Pedobacter sp. ASV12]|uniref:Bax inhibitor-1/YccA family protein n=1 Tax=Pedobacter sp. ASV12 TaxID=2795120 RepID=UPI0018EE31D8|nr:Bax inhibitor-1/YccA family protein [Pedobacter sp. ASV12]